MARRNPTYRAQWEKEYGIGDDPISGFFILPDGLFLLGRAVGQDHRNIVFVAPVAQHRRFDGVFGGTAKLMYVIMRKHRLVRWIPEGWAADLVVRPTGAQVRVLAELADRAHEYGHSEMRLIQRRMMARTGEYRGRGSEKIVSDGYELEEAVRRFWK